MKELSNTEMLEVSGAGDFSDAFAELGNGIGAIVDAARGKGDTTGATIGAKLGNGIGAIIDASASFVNDILSIFKRK